MRRDPQGEMGWLIHFITGRCPTSVACMSAVEPDYIETGAREDLRRLPLSTRQNIEWESDIVIDRNSDLWILRETRWGRDQWTEIRKRTQNDCFEHSMHGISP